LKKIASFFVLVLLFAIAVPAWAEENASKGDLTVLPGNKSLLQGDYKLTNNLTLEAQSGEVTDYEEENKYKNENNKKDYFLRTDLRYQMNGWLGVKLGGRYDSQPEETIPYGGIDFATPFGSNNLKFTGFYNYNYEGKDWANYEFAWRIEMYKGQYIYAGVSGDAGTGFIPYTYNQDNDPEFFLRGDFTWAGSKLSMNYQPLLYATGEIFTVLNFRYAVSDRTNILLNLDDDYDHNMKYRLGIEHKF